MEKSDHDILIRVEAKVEGLTDEVRMMRDGTKEDINKLNQNKLDRITFDEHVKNEGKMGDEIDKIMKKTDLHDKLIYIGLGIVLTLQFVILLINK